MDQRLPVGSAVDAVVAFLLANLQPLFDAVTTGIGSFTAAVAGLLLWFPSAALTALIAALALWRVGWRFALFTLAALALLQGMGLWVESIDTLALVLSATAVSLALGLPLGIWAARHDAVDRAVRPLLDFMQTMPAFVYLIPAAMFFGLGKVPGVIATIIFSMPPAVRLVNLGIRQVPKEVVEAGLAFGCTPRQLLFKVQLPTAMRSIMAGVNQTIMLSLSMVVIASMIGAGGLGKEVLRGIQRLQVGVGFEGGIGVVLLAIILDRITQSFGAGPRQGLAARAKALFGGDGASRSPAALARGAGVATLAAAAVGLFLYVYGAGPAGPAATPAARVDAASAAVPVLSTAALKDATGAAPAQSRPAVRIGWTAWADAEFVTKLARRLLQDRLGYRVNLIMSDIGIQYQGVATGDLDLMLMAWLPNTHRNYWDKVAAQVLDLGPLYLNARLGWVVPDYVPVDAVSSLADLRKPGVAQRLNHRIYGIDPGSGLMQASAKALAGYGLKKYDLVASSGAGMTAALSRAIRRHQWVVATAWSPHWIFNKWHLRYLNDPKHLLGGREEIHAVARRDLNRRFGPDLAAFITRMYIPMPELQAAMLDARDHGVEQAVDTYIDDHAARVDYWVTGVPAPATS